jgi:serine/threonine protein phosphatase PrpC
MADRSRLARFVHSLFEANDGFLNGRRAMRETVREFAQSDQAVRLADQFIRELEDQWIAFSRAETPSLPELKPESAPAPARTAAPPAPVAEPAPTPQAKAEEVKEEPKHPAPAAESAPTLPGAAMHERIVYTPLAKDAQSHDALKPPTTPAPTSPSPASTGEGLRPGEIPPDLAAKARPPSPPPVRFNIPRNAKVNEAFESSIDASMPVEILEVRGDESLGISYDAEHQTLKGTATEAGDHKLKVRFKAEDHSETFEAEVNLTVIPDPKSLWKNRLSDRNDPLWKPDEDKHYLKSEDGLQLAAASKRGRSHAHAGTCRDDDFYLRSKDGWQILAVADGAGSAKRSRRGSLIATREAGDHVTRALAGESGQKIIEIVQAEEPNLADFKLKAYEVLGHAALKAAKAIEEEAQQAGVSHKDYSTTLLIAFHRKTGRGHLIATYWVGDGAIGAYHKGERLTLMGEGDSGEYAGQTRFLDRSLMRSGEEVMKRINITLLPELTALVLMTDGITDPKFETDRNLERRERWDAFWQEVEPLLADESPDQRLLEWLDFWSPGNHDDRTIALLWGGNQ